MFIALDTDVTDYIKRGKVKAYGELIAIQKLRYHHKAKNEPFYKKAGSLDRIIKN
jgi:hypothetical protein